MDTAMKTVIVNNSPVTVIKSVKGFFECFKNKLNVFDLIRVIFRVNTSVSTLTLKMTD